jgi:membrane protein DedA with SNARE-associated domain
MGLTPEKLERLEATFMRHSSWLLFTSKATLGFGTSAGTVPMLMTAGAMKYPFRMYLFLNLLGEFVLLAIMLSIGYLFGTSYQTISADFKQAFLIGIGILVVLGAIMLARLNKQKGQEQ